MAQGFSIQIDNLCQFLPQDKVVEFAQMSPIEILQSTQRAAAAPEMLKHHETLKQLRAKQKETMSDNRGAREYLENLEHRQEMQRTEVERLRERAVTQKRLDWLERCRPIPKYAQAKQNLKEAKTRQKKLAGELRKLRDESGPALKKVTAKQAYRIQVQTLKSDRQKEVTTCEKACDEIYKEVEEAETKMKDCDNKHEAETKSLRKKRDDRNRATQAVADLKHQKQTPPEDFDARAMNQEIQDRTSRMREIETQQDDRTTRRADAAHRGNVKKLRIDDINGKIEALDTVTGKQETKLQAISTESFRAWKWIQENQKEFKQRVFGPPLVECSLKDPQFANIVESFLQKNDFQFITVQCQEDFKFLQQKLNREMKLHDISLRQCSNTSSNEARPLSEEQMHDLGLDSWVIDHLQGPPQVLAMLCMQRNLHRSAIALGDIDSRQHEELARSQISGYAAGGKIYQFTRRAEYGAGASSATARFIKPATRWTEQPVDMGRKAALEREANEITEEALILRDEFLALKAEIVALTKEWTTLKNEVEEIRADKDAKQKVRAEWNALDTKITTAEEKEQQAKDSIIEVREHLQGIEQERDDALLNKAEAVLRYAASMTELKEMNASLLEAEMLLIEANSDFETLAEQSKHIKVVIDQKDKEEKEAAEVIKETITTGNKFVKEIQALRKAGMELEEQGDPGLSELLTDISDRGPTPEGLEEEIDSEKAKLEVLVGGNQNSIKEYENRAKDIEKIRERLSNYMEQQEELRAHITEERANWEPELLALVAKIDAAFSDSFARIGCAGQVAVYKASSDDPADCTAENGGTDNGLDFANWAVHISVKFRQNEALSLLDSHRQSGGERAVSTIFYLMALQSLSRAPFRVVDEINQGMDPRNERMVHGRMVDIAADDGGSQYFLITPKLLSGLKYRRGMTVLCIVSGENMPDAKEEGNKVDFGAFVRKARELGLAREAGAEIGRRVDSGVGMGSSFRGSVEVGA